jgi:DNA primase
MEIQDIKNCLPILTVLALYSLEPDKHLQIHCPFHADDKPSCKIYTDTNTFHCFACGKTGDAIQFIQEKEHCTKHEAILRATALINNEKLTISNESPMPAKPVNKNDKTLSELFPLLLQGIQKSPNAQEYCGKRGIDYKTLEIGYNSGTHYSKLKNCIVFPLKNKAGSITSLYGRSILNNANARHYYSENRTGLYPCYPNHGTETLIITEAIIDAATLLQLPEITSQPARTDVQSGGFTILSAYGTNGLTKEHKQAIAELKPLKEIIFFFDGDTAGREGVNRLAPELKMNNEKLIISAVETPPDEDINGLYIKYGAECLVQLINERKPVLETEPSFSIEIPLIEERPDVQTLNSSVSKELDTSNPNKIIFESVTARYIVKGSLCKQLDKMLVSLDVQHLETGIKYRTRLDLYEEKQTRKEAREAAEKLELRSDLIDADLSKLTDLLEEYRDNGLQENNGSNDKDPLPDLPTQTKCKEFLSKPDLVNRINELIGKSGITGELNNRLFLFIIATSHKMPDTLHALIQGSSGSGKTHLLSKIADLMPPEKVEKFTRVTENSFYNYDEFFFVHKLVCLEDIDGLKEEALFAWRELISNNQLRSSTSLKDDNGNIKSGPRMVRGPMASVCATTHGHIYEDNMSRLFIIAVDESNEQTERIMGYQKLKASGMINSNQEKKAVEFLQNCVRMLKPCQVINPFANQVQLPPQAHKIRRLNELFLAFVKQITIINQYQRKRDSQNRLITEKEDLQMAVNILFDSIFLKVDELDGSLRQFFESLKTYLEEKPNAQNYEFTRREIRKATGVSNTGLHRALYVLTDLEYITVSGGYQNRGLKYKISYWDNVAKLREQIRQYLLNQLNNL